MLKSQAEVAKLFTELKTRSGMSWAEIARLCGFSHQSALQRYYEVGGSSKNYLPKAIIDVLLAHMVGKGVPPVEVSEIMRMAPLMGFHPENPFPPHQSAKQGLASAPYTGRWTGPDKIPVVAYAAASGEKVAINLEHDAPIRWIERPHWLAGVNKATAVQIMGESMEPRYRDGEVVFVNMAMQPAKGKDCIFNTRDGFTHIKQYLKSDNEYFYFHQWNPVKDIRFHRRDIENLYQIVGRE